MAMNSTDKTTAILGATFIVMFFSLVGIIVITNAYVNTPTDWTININMDSETKDSIIRVSQLQEEIARLELSSKELDLEIANKQVYGNNSPCVFTWVDSFLDNLTHYEYSKECYMVK